MHIRELRISGFKSFVDQTQVRIEAGLTGVVGPNGCGKSNILESIRWAMGANSAKAMRAEDMDDVIFAGAASRPQRDHADVTLVLDNTDRRAPAQFNDAETLEIVRRIRRGQGSTYRINGREARARDVQILFADASTGANSPALVRQGQISELIAAKPENRRRILEEAAGVGGMHARRHEAELKLRAAETNLQRLDDALNRLKEQLAHLQKQSKQAQRYRVISQEIRALEALIAGRRWQEADASASELAAVLRAADREAGDAAQEAARLAAEAAQRTVDLKPLREEEIIAAAVLRRLDLARAEIDRDLDDAKALLNRLQAELIRLNADREREEQLAQDALAALARLEGESQSIGGAQEADDAAARAAAEARAIDAESKANAAQSAFDAANRAQAANAAARSAAQTRLRDAEGQVQRLTAHLAGLDADAARLGALDAARAAAETAEQTAARHAEAMRAGERAAEAADAALGEARAAETRALEPLRSAEAATARLKAEIRGLEAVTRRADSRHAPALEGVRPEAGLERAVAAAFGEDIEAALDPEAPTFWTQTAARPATIHGAPLAGQVEAPPALAARLALTGLVDPADGPAVQKLLQPGEQVVSRDGDLWRWDGYVRKAGAPLAAAVRLEQRNRLIRLAAEVGQAEQALTDATALREAAREDLRRADEAARAARLALPGLRQAAQAAQAQAAGLAREADRLALHSEALADQRDRVLAELEAAGLRQAEAANALAALPVSGAIDLDPLRQEVETSRAAALEARAIAKALVREAEARAQRRIQIAQESAGWRQRLDQASARMQVLDAECGRTEAARATAMAAPDAITARRAKLFDEHTEAAARRKAAADLVAAAETAMVDVERAARTAEARHAAAREARAGAEARAAAARERLEEIAKAALEALGGAPDELIARARAHFGAALDGLATQDGERRLERLRRERDGLGAVNLAADDEATEVARQIADIETERGDVTGAISKLRSAIASINAEGRERLLAAFAMVNGHFQRLFQTLFAGGAAELRLTEGEDPLEAGLEIYACPPGKRLGLMSLMSGGEQALTASALIFAVFLTAPAPLCVLDEVDAPLDDSNVDRFCRMLDEIRRLADTRFLVITHNPVTMSRMDRLYGVTMPEAGVSQLVSVDLSSASALVAAE